MLFVFEVDSECSIAKNKSLMITEKSSWLPAFFRQTKPPPVHLINTVL